MLFFFGLFFGLYWYKLSCKALLKAAEGSWQISLLLLLHVFSLDTWAKRI